MVVAKLPFVPISLFSGLTHRNLDGTDFTDCSALFAFILSSMSVKPIISNLFDYSLPKRKNGISELVSKSYFSIPI
ncbi:Transmembrane and coiled-coil domains protein 1 [Zancudomyces culisetae]|uniref:Transmembrane and coiled-coil domains protein 1 n=1 Tax=Zancudomyces culisetae TaxID=1213189 RepID=A0A1R1PQW0_ZANCU|nr:Transmembrane and coiled-coil domains protein 1 [Zancudomyces culisetae]|eukprot:OMH83321.1 Transmembrane and coiled-coil domains protein 1 [Zancudomyces culisetae]